MNSFEHFKRSRLSQKQNSQVSYKSFNNQSMIPFHLQNVTFSTNQIIFQTNTNQQICLNQELKVYNHTGTRLYFQIHCSNPEYYQCRPSQDILEINGVVNIIFRFHRHKFVSNMSAAKSRDSSFLSNLVIKDVFEFRWAQITQKSIKNNQVPRISNKQLLKIRIKDNNHQKQIRKQQFEQYSPIKNNGIQISQISKDLSKAKMYSNENSLASTQYIEYSSLLTIPIIASVALFSFMIGYVSS